MSGILVCGWLFMIDNPRQEKVRNKHLQGQWGCHEFGFFEVGFICSQHLVDTCTGYYRSIQPSVVVEVYEALAGLQEEEEGVRPYLLVWLHGMDNGSIEPGYLTTIQKRLRHRVIFMVPWVFEDWEA